MPLKAAELLNESKLYAIWEGSGYGQAAVAWCRMHILQRKGPALLLLFYPAALPPHKGGRAVITAHKKQNSGFMRILIFFFCQRCFFQIII